MTDPSKLSKRERQILDVIYAHGEATISQVLEEMPDPPMRGALRTLLRIMEQKGQVTRRQEGRRIIYRPTHHADVPADRLSAACWTCSSAGRWKRP